MNPRLKDSTPPTPSGGFVSTLSALHGGQVLAQLDDALRNVTNHANAAQAKGKLSLEITITPNGVGLGDTPIFRVSEKIKTTLPEKPRQAQSFFVDDDGNLTRRGPNQGDMGLELVTPAEKPASPAGLARAASS